jgi:hypothetical protein
VVIGFTPLKTRLQAIVDRRFKELRDPASDLEVFVTEVHHALSPPDRDRTLRRLLEVAVASYNASGGEIQVRVSNAAATRLTVGTTAGPASHRVVVTKDELQVTLVLFGSDPSRDSDILQTTLAAVLDEIGQSS